MARAKNISNTRAAIAIVKAVIVQKILFLFLIFFFYFFFFVLIGLLVCLFVVAAVSSRTAYARIANAHSLCIIIVSYNSLDEKSLALESAAFK